VRTFTIPIRTVSATNAREHHMVRARRVKSERWATMAMCPPGMPVPCTVHMTRVAPRPLDDDNLRGALKGPRDQIAVALKVDDRDPRVTWEYAQRKGAPNEYAVEVRVEATAEAVT
jgi:hypothetical protein